MDQALLAYLPQDRRHALARGEALPRWTSGTALFADISGFTPLTEALAREMGPRDGAEVLTHHLNLVYDALIAEVDHFGGSVIGFAGDAILCWFDEDRGERAATCALAMQRAMGPIAPVTLPSLKVVNLAMKIGIASGPVRRFLVGDPDIQLIDVLAGETLTRMAAAEHHAQKGEIVLDEQSATRIAEVIQLSAWRVVGATDERFAVLERLSTSPSPIAPTPAPPALSKTQVRPWLLPVVYTRLQSGQGEFLAELRPAVALFLGFEGLDYDRDERVENKLDSYIRWTQGVLARYGGTLIQLTIGDKGGYLYAAFGAPSAHEDDATRAVLAAHELLTPPPQLAFVSGVRAGISQGTMRAGAYGSQARRTYGVLGDEVNLAARLMQHAAPGQLLISEWAQQAAGAHFAWQALPALQVKGKEAAVPRFALEGTRRPRPLRLQEPIYALPMVGREPEVALIVQKLEAVLAGHGQIVRIMGEAGIGKSRLVAEIIRLAYERNLIGYGAECQSYGTGSSYLVWQPIWRGFFELAATDGVEEQAEQLATALAQINPHLLPRLPLLGTVLNLALPDNDLTRDLDPQLRKESLKTLLLDCLRARVRNTPHFFILEDCHWLDPLSHDLLELLGRNSASLPVLIVIVSRPLEAEQSPPISHLPHFTEIVLTGFTPAEADSLITLKLDQLFGKSAGRAEALRSKVTERAQGNPFFIEELLSYLRDQQLDPADSQSLAQLELPTGLYSLVLSRIDQLSESEKITIKIASVIGRLFRAGWLWDGFEVLGGTEQVRTSLEQLARLDLTPLDREQPELEYLFKHIVTRDVAYQSLASSTRALLHEQLALYIERSYHDTLDQHVDLLAHHYERTSNEAKKREYLLKAGEAAEAAYANEVAITYYQRLLPLLPDGAQGDVLARLAGVLSLVGRWEEALATYQEALHLAEMAGEQRAQAQCQKAVGVMIEHRGDPAAGVLWLERARALYMSLGDQAGLAQVLIEIGIFHLRTGECEKAHTLSEEGLALFRELGDRRGMAYTFHNMAQIAYVQGDYDLARSCLEKSLHFSRELQDRLNISVSLSRLGTIEKNQERYEAARACLEESLALSRELGDKRGMAATLNRLGMLARELGDYESAWSLCNEGLLLRRELGQPGGIAGALDSLGLVAYLQGRYEVALSTYEESLRLFYGMQHKWGVAYSLSGVMIVTGAMQHLQRAACLAGVTEQLLEVDLKGKLNPEERTHHDRMVESVREQLGTVAFEAALAEGQAMMFDEAIAFALARGG